MSHTTKASVRNQQITDMIERFFVDIATGRYTHDTKLEESFEILFRTQTWGFREIVLVVAIARLRDSSYRASHDLYACNPRSLFEKPIKQALDGKGIPTRQSGPLNVAKGAERLNVQWAAGREPRHVAEEVVRIVEIIERLATNELENFTKLLLCRFLQEANIVQHLTVIVEPQTDPAFLYTLIKTLIDEVPDQGNTPQHIVGYLLESYHEDLQTGIKVQGHTDRASTTSITGKKLGDVSEELRTGIITSAYEVTVKNFGTQRVREAYDAVQAYRIRTNVNTREIIVICRKQDAHPDAKALSNLYLGKLEYQNVVFHFVEIYEWIISQLLRMTLDSRRIFFEKLQEYVANKDTSAKVKYVWSTIFKE